MNEDHVRRREQHASKKVKAPELSIAQARANRRRIDWAQPVPVGAARAARIQRFDNYPLEELLGYIDWMPFFNAWEFAGKFPDILTDPVVGEAASNLYADARAMLKQLIAERWLQGARGRRAVSGERGRRRRRDLHGRVAQRGAHDAVLPASAEGQARGPAARVPGGLHRAEVERRRGLHRRVRGDRGHRHRAARRALRAAHDDYSSIMLKALADRLAEACAEHFHERVRRELWGYASRETLTNEQLIREEYRGIRPAPGYPACPDHTEKAKLWELLDAEKNAGIRLTESFAMYPTAAVSGWYFAHPGVALLRGRQDRSRTRWRTTPGARA